MPQDEHQRCDILQPAAEVWGPGPSALSRLKQLEEERVRLRRDGGLVAKQSHVTGCAIKKALAELWNKTLDVPLVVVGERRRAPDPVTRSYAASARHRSRRIHVLLPRGRTGLLPRLEGLAHDAATTVESSAHALPISPRRILTAFTSALGKIASIGGQLAGHWRTLRPFGKLAGINPVPHHIRRSSVVTHAIARIKSASVTLSIMEFVSTLTVPV